MKRIPLWCDGEIDMRELATIFRNAGYHLHCNSQGQTCVDRVPDFLRATQEHVVPMKRRKAA